MAKDYQKEDVNIKPAFQERYAALTDWEAFLSCSLRFLRRSIRVNTLKMSVHELVARLEPEWKLTPIPWCPEGFWIEHRKGERRDIGNIPEHSLGYFYIQEAASMIPPLVMDPRPGETVLDMCAAPGSKATQIGMYLKNEGTLVANDYTGIRMQSLGINLQRCGLTNSVATLMEGRWFKGHQFDRILVDAPCSGTGTIRKSLKTLRIWNPNMVRRISGQQRQLLESAYQNLKPGGVIVYSTCTLEPEEDEGIISWLLHKHEDIHTEKIDRGRLPGLKTSKVVTSFGGVDFHPGVKDCIRIWPQDNDTEGFFICRLVKEKRETKKEQEETKDALPQKKPDLPDKGF
ncbi:MAG: RsmB/NOP family class I SAM-dependent RNA methyltransferase [DPANN group archaeon]|nr:RsmB/NOP family class I SAM-dependent RNA methyltransferase [DPANN group archaeon]